MGKYIGLNGHTHISKTYTHMHNTDMYWDIKLSVPVTNMDYPFIGHCSFALK